MAKTALIFPGQGAQYVAMGKDLIENFSYADNKFDEAGEILGFDLKKICLNGPEEMLNNTENTQPAIFTVSMILYHLLQKNIELEPAFFAGHSLGEYSAFCAAGALNFKEGVTLVRKRGQYMNEAVPAGQGSMAAIIGLEKEMIENLCQNVEGVCEIANFNTPSQIVISGTSSAVAEVNELAREKGAKKVVKLAVSGPFHSSLMKPAQEKLKKELQQVKFKSIQKPVVVNAYAREVKEKDEIKRALLAQLVNGVLWVDSMQFLIKEGIDTFLEIGPGRTLKGLMRRINRKVVVHSIKDAESLKKYINIQKGSI